MITAYEDAGCGGATTSFTVFYQIAAPVTLAPATGGPGTNINNPWLVGPWTNDADNLDLVVSGADVASLGWVSPLGGLARPPCGLRDPAY